MRHFQYIGNADPLPLMYELFLNESLWGENPERAAGNVHRETQDIWVRYNKKPETPEEFEHWHDEHHGVFYPAWTKLPALRPLVFNLMARVQATELGAVLLIKTPVGKKIYPHVDNSWHVEHFPLKCHMTLQGDEGSWYWCMEEKCQMPTGSIWAFDNRLQHGVVNEGNVDRIMLIVCMRTI